MIASSPPPDVTLLLLPPDDREHETDDDPGVQALTEYLITLETAARGTPVLADLLTSVRKVVDITGVYPAIIEAHRLAMFGMAAVQRAQATPAFACAAFGDAAAIVRLNLAHAYALARAQRAKVAAPPPTPNPPPPTPRTPNPPPHLRLVT